jgi:hypothetical protein
MRRPHYLGGLIAAAVVKKNASNAALADAIRAKKVGGCPPEEQPPQQHYPIYLNHERCRSQFAFCLDQISSVAAFCAEQSLRLTMAILENQKGSATLFSKNFLSPATLRASENSGSRKK